MKTSSLAKLMQSSVYNERLLEKLKHKLAEYANKTSKINECIVEVIKIEIGRIKKEIKKVKELIEKLKNNEKYKDIVEAFMSFKPVKETSDMLPFSYRTLDKRVREICNEYSFI